MFRAWTSPTFFVNQPGYAYWPGWYGSPQTSEIYEQFRLIVDGTGHFSYGLRPSGLLHFRTTPVSQD